MGDHLKNRTKNFALRVIKMVQQAKGNLVVGVILKQIVRSATSVGANYRSALRSRSAPDFISRIAIAEEEADESCYWLELMIEIEAFPKRRLEPLLKEANELTAMLTASGKTAKQNLMKMKTLKKIPSNKTRSLPSAIPSS